MGSNPTGGSLSPAWLLARRNCRASEPHTISIGAMRRKQLPGFAPSELDTSRVPRDPQRGLISGITSALHAEGPGFNPQCVHNCCTPGMCVCFSLRQPQARPAVRSIRLRPARARKASHCLNNARKDQIFPYSLRGSNPRPMAHKTIALTTELREHASALATRTGERLKLFAGVLPGEATKHPV